MFKKSPLFIATLMIVSSAYAVTASYSVIEEMAIHKNVKGLKTFKNTYHTLDYTDENGRTPLCRAIARKDYAAYQILAENGADRSHNCVKALTLPEIQAFNNGYKAHLASAAHQSTTDFAISPIIWDIAGVVGVGAAVAVAASTDGGGHGGSDDKGEGVGKPNEGDPLTPEFFETGEYNMGNFLSNINASDAYARFYNGKTDASGKTSLVTNVHEVKVGVIDTGVYADHIELEGRVLSGFNYYYGVCQSSGQKNCWTYDSVTHRALLKDSTGRVVTQVNMEQKDWDDKVTWDTGYVWDATTTTPHQNPDEAWHGTGVSGVIAANKNDVGMHGVALNAKIIPVKYDLMSGVSKPIISLVDSGAKVINMSLGVADDTLNASLAKTDPVRFLRSVGDSGGFTYINQKKSTVLVLSAGNEGLSQSNVLSGYALLGEHDSYKDDYGHLKNLMINVVSVGADNKLSSFSNKCGATADFCIAAPGENIVMPGESGMLNVAKGTSFSAPVVSGAIAFLMGAYPNLTAEQVTQLIFETATPLGDTSVYGHGLLNLNAATAPVGTMSLAAGDSLHGERVNLNTTRLYVPYAMKSALTELPKTVAAFDKYERSYDIPTETVVRVNERDVKVFQNELHRFMKFDAVKKTQGDAPVTFAFSTAAKSDSKTGFGGMELAWNGDKNQTKFYYIEDTRYGMGNYFDRVTLNPFTAVQDAYGIENQYNLASTVAVNFGFVTGDNALFKTTDETDGEYDSLTAFDTGISYSPLKQLKLSVNGGLMREENSLLGLRGRGGFDMPSAQTYYMGFGAYIEPVKNWVVSGTYYYGMTPGQKVNAFLRTHDLISDSIAFDARRTITEDKYIGMMLSSPLRVREGSADFTLPGGRDYYSDTVYRHTTKINMKQNAREWDTGIYGGYAFTEQVRAKALGMVRFHPEHMAGAAPDYRIMFGLQWNWN